MGAHTRRIARFFGLATLTAALLVGSAQAAMAAEKIHGTITESLENGFIMQRQNGASVTVSIPDAKHKWKPSDLIPGLNVKVEGKFDDAGTLVAHKIAFTKADRRLAQTIRAGLKPTDEQVQRNTADIVRQGQTMATQGQAITAQGREIGGLDARVADNTSKIVGTAGALAATDARIGHLADYEAIETLTVYFKNDRAEVPAAYLPQLADLAAKAKVVPGYMVQVYGYASAVGRHALNEALSHRRAEAVTEILQQQGGIPSTNLFVPSAMGTTDQVGNNATRKGQAENRRVVVTILQNKGIVQP